jgi:predicted nucleotidyltransferase
MYLPAGKERLLKVFFRDPWAELHQRELARRAKVPVQNTHKYLGECVGDRMLLRREVSNMTFFQPNWESDHLLKIFEIFEVSQREDFLARNKSIARILTKATATLVAESHSHVQLVMLFGSVARGTWTPRSDIDLLVLGSSSGNVITNAFTKAKVEVESVLELSPVFTTVEAAVTGFRERKAFHQEVWGDRVVLYNEFLFWQIVRRAFSMVP